MLGDGPPGGSGPLGVLVKDSLLWPALPFLTLRSALDLGNRSRAGAECSWESLIPVVVFLWAQGCLLSVRPAHGPPVGVSCALA